MANDQRAPVHYLRGNESEWSPRHLAFIDTETYPSGTQGTQELRLRLWVAGVVDRRPKGNQTPKVATAYGFDRASLATWLDGATNGNTSLWTYAHNLGFDLTVSRLPDFMHRLGWRMTQWQFAGRNVSGRMRKGRKCLRLCDSGSWLPNKLADIGLAVGRPKLAMPAFDASEEAWLTYCEGDVLVLAEAMLTLLAWWDDQKLGHWTTSGPACGWSSMRHRSRVASIVINPEPTQVAHDRMAIRGGRRDVTRVGVIPGGPFALVDFSNAYLSVLANCLLPQARKHHAEAFEPDGLWVDGNQFGVIAECQVNTPTPRYPLRTPSGVFYPVGRFRTVLASPEIAWARDGGHLEAIGAGWVHDLGKPMARWGAWVLSMLDPDASDTPAVVRMMAKQWGRSVPGRFAARSSRIADRGPALWPGWHLERGTAGPEHAPAADVHIAGRHWWVTFDQESDNSYPAVLAFIESYVRVALGKMLEALGEPLWVCCDTDGLVVDLNKAASWLSGRQVALRRTRGPMSLAEAVCGCLEPLTWPLVPRVKVLSETLTVAGPQHYSGDTFSRASGMPASVELDQEGHPVMWSWPKVQWQMAHGSPNGYVRVETHWTHPSTTAHRWVLTDGTALPVSAAINAQGQSVIAGCYPPAHLAIGVALAEHQSPALRGLY